MFKTKLVELFGINVGIFQPNLRQIHQVLESKGIGPAIEEQEEQQSSDGTDGSSTFTDPAVSSATDLQIG